MKHKKNIAESRLLPILLLFIMILPMFFYLCIEKDIWFCDEVYTFESANSGVFYYINPLDEAGKWSSGQIINDYLSKGEKVFNFIEIEKYLYTDHVPLYFLFIRLFSLITYGTISKWTGLALNFLFYVISALIMYQIFKFFTNSKYLSAIAAAGMSLHPILLSEATMIRMYMMLTALTLLFILVSRKEFWGQKKWYPIITVIATTMGLLTHYYFWIFVACFSLVYCIKLLFQKSFKEMFEYIGIMVFSLGFTTVGFPLVWKRTLFSKDGNGQVTGALSSILNFDKLLDRLRELVTTMNSEIFPTLSQKLSTLGNTILFTVLTIVCIFAVVHFALSLTSKKRELFVMVFVSAILDIFLISWLTVSLSVRYLWTPMIIILLCIVIAVIGTIREKKLALPIAAIFLLCSLISSCNLDNIDWLKNRTNEEKEKVTETISDTTTLVFYDNPDFIFHCSFYDFRLSGPLMRIGTDTTLEALDFGDADSIIVFTVDGNKSIDSCVASINDFSKREVVSVSFVGPSGYMSVYELKLSSR